MADDARAGTELIEQLLGDPELRAEFRADPGAVLREHGLDDLADQVGDCQVGDRDPQASHIDRGPHARHSNLGLPAGRRAMLTLELRESRSSLAGVIVAAAAEGVDFTHVAEHAAPRLGRDAGHAISHLVKKLSSHPNPKPVVSHHRPEAAPKPPPKPHLTPVAQPLPEMAKPVPRPAYEQPQMGDPTQPVTGGAAHQPGVPVDHPVDPVPAAPAAPAVSLTYPGDSATPQQIAAWMGANAERAGLPAQLPVIASLTESGMRNLNYGDRDSVGFFQMRVGIWDQGAYSGFPSDPQLQLQWFINEALSVRQSNPSLADSSSSWGDWVADIERPAAEYRYRYQLQLPEAQELLRGSGLSATPGTEVGAEPSATGVDPTTGDPTPAGVDPTTGAPTTGPPAAAPTTAARTSAAPPADPTSAPVTAQPVFHGVIHRPPLGHAVTTTATACVGAKCTAGGSDVETGFDSAGLVRYAYGKQGISLPSTPAQQCEVGAAVPRGALQRGDAVFFGRSHDQIQNVGIYVGDGKVVTASDEKAAVSIDSLQSASSHYLGARRYSAKLLTGAGSYARTLPTIKR